MFKRMLVLALGCAAFLLIFAESAFAFASVRFAIEEICKHMEGSLGGLLMTAAGIGGLAAAAFGNFRASQSLIVVGIGAFAISAILSLYFPRAASACQGNAVPSGNEVDDPGNPFGEGVNVARTADPFGKFQPNLNAQDNALNDDVLAVAAGRDADFANAARINQTGENLEEGMLEFDTSGDVFGDKF